MVRQLIQSRPEHLTRNGILRGPPDVAGELGIRAITACFQGTDTSPTDVKVSVLLFAAGIYWECLRIHVLKKLIKNVKGLGTVDA